MVETNFKHNEPIQVVKEIKKRNSEVMDVVKKLFKPDSNTRGIGYADLTESLTESQMLYGGQIYDPGTENRRRELQSTRDVLRASAFDAMEEYLSEHEIDRILNRAHLVGMIEQFRNALIIRIIAISAPEISTIEYSLARYVEARDAYNALDLSPQEVPFSYHLQTYGSFGNMTDGPRTTLGTTARAVPGSIIRYSEDLPDQELLS
jgi:hypothetical protein